MKQAKFPESCVRKGVVTPLLPQLPDDGEPRKEMGGRGQVSKYSSAVTSRPCLSSPTLLLTPVRDNEELCKERAGCPPLTQLPDQKYPNPIKQKGLTHVRDNLSRVTVVQFRKLL